MLLKIISYRSDSLVANEMKKLTLYSTEENNGGQSIDM